MTDNIDIMALSNDQQYLYDIYTAISLGECGSDLALKKILVKLFTQDG